MLSTMRLSPNLFAALLMTAATFNAPYAAAQSAEAPPAEKKEGGGFGGFLRSIGKSVDDAVKTGTQGAQGAVDTVNQTHAAINGTVRGRVALQGGKTATCFNGITSCYLGAPNMTSPGQSQGVPLMLVLADGRAVGNNADQLAHFGVLVMPQTAAPVGNTDTGYSDGLGCTNPNWTKDEIIRRRREIMDCQADEITERAYQRDLARRQQRDAAAGGNQAAQRKLEAETKARFEEIQRNAAKPPK